MSGSSLRLLLTHYYFLCMLWFLEGCKFHALAKLCITLVDPGEENAEMTIRTVAHDLWRYTSIHITPKVFNALGMHRKVLQCCYTSPTLRDLLCMENVPRFSGGLTRTECAWCVWLVVLQLSDLFGCMGVVGLCLNTFQLYNGHTLNVITDALPS